jgi:hypothetical protein
LAPGRKIGSVPSGDNSTDLVEQASSLLARQATQLPPIALEIPKGPPGAMPSPSGLEAPGWLRPPIGSGADPVRLRHQAHEMLEALLQAFGTKEPAPGEPEDRVPLIRCMAPVTPGNDGCAVVRVANDEATPSEVTLYCTNLAADSGYDIPSLRISISPRRVTIASKGEAKFEIKISVPQQTPAGIYSGLIQATGARYVKAVVSVQVT